MNSAALRNLPNLYDKEYCLTILFIRCHPFRLLEVWRGRQPAGKLQDLYQLVLHAIQVMNATGKRHTLIISYYGIL